MDRCSIHPLSVLKEGEMNRMGMFVGVVGTFALVLGLVTARPAYVVSAHSCETEVM